ncbi:MAG: hypothetical protein IJ715_02025 [Bacilli bacterium]|nr:hypothetical protein [Bacilli bacterium]
MNNKGFTLQELLFFISLFMMILVVCVVVIDSNIAKFNVTHIEPNQIKEDVDIESEDKTVSVIDTTIDQYKILLEKMASTAKIYITTNYTGKTDRIIIKTSKLVEDEYMEELVDPIDNTIKCRGYIVYDGYNVYTPYLNCGNNFKSDNYNETFE